MFKGGKTLKVNKKDHTPKPIILEESVTKVLEVAEHLEESILLPPNQDQNEWIAIHCFDFFKEVELLYESIQEACTPETCPLMQCGPMFEYRWKEGKELQSLSAREYIKKCLKYVQKELDNESVFPCTIGTSFGKKFTKDVPQIFKRLFRIYGHLYLHHLNQIIQLEEEPHLNTSFKHFILFATHFNLLDKKEVQPMMCVIHYLAPQIESKYQ